MWSMVAERFHTKIFDKKDIMKSILFFSFLTFLGFFTVFYQFKFVFEKNPGNLQNNFKLKLISNLVLNFVLI